MAGDSGRGGKLLRRLGFALIVIALLLIVLDRGGDYAAERLAADHLKSSQHLQSSPDVSIDGFPFLTQFASGDYDHISVDASNVAVGPKVRPIELSQFHVDLNQLSVSRNYSTFHVASATATARIDYADLSRTLGIKVRYAGGERIRASKKFTVFGKDFNPTISVEPVYVNGALSFTKTNINGLDETAGSIASALHKIFGTDVPLQGIPFDVRIRSLRVDSAGLELSLVGSDLTYRS